MKNDIRLVFALGICLAGCQEPNKSSESCKPVFSSNSFEAAFIKTISCGSVSDGELVKQYNGECGGVEMMVDMKKYISEATGKECEGNPVYKYTKKNTN